MNIATSCRNSRIQDYNTGGGSRGVTRWRGEKDKSLRTVEEARQNTFREKGGTNDSWLRKQT